VHIEPKDYCEIESVQFEGLDLSKIDKREVKK
jgi:hypothetical protein